MQRNTSYNRAIKIIPNINEKEVAPNTWKTSIKIPILIKRRMRKPGNQRGRTLS